MKTITYAMTWKNKLISDEINTLDDAVDNLTDILETIEWMRDDGVVLVEGNCKSQLYFTTTDPKIADKYGMEDISKMGIPDECSEDACE
jgi:hypothetical protein